MKKSYEKPAICVVQIRYQNHLLVDSQTQRKRKFVDDDDYDDDDWDFDGGQ
ncbi:hypothetical protein [Prevotella sp. E2-28]|uniref:hypothetical protein n=1 Tax=Prevotella sp. E2-28 TaxID=2913620 RepID=UPI001EDBC158|nr:hypothetical protein [Prevotella sp. E2-28]UKK53273.1 hypothetical protein L6465_11870 [Prevotella sp. E2-28]